MLEGPNFICFATIAFIALWTGVMVLAQSEKRKRIRKDIREEFPGVVPGEIERRIKQRVEMRRLSPTVGERSDE